MPPFSATSVLTVKEKVDALLQQGETRDGVLVHAGDRADGAATRSTSAQATGSTSPTVEAASESTDSKKVRSPLRSSSYLALRQRHVRTNPDGSTELLETRKTFSRRAVDQIGLIREINSLVVLSGTRSLARDLGSSPCADDGSSQYPLSCPDSTISLYDPSTLVLLSSLPQTRGA